MTDVHPVRIVPLRWWHLEQVHEIEQELFGDEQWTPAMFWSELAQTETRWYRAALDDADHVVGYAGLCVYGEPPDGQAWVQTIAVDSAAQRSGIGGGLLGVLIDHAAELAAPTISLEVRADNGPAQRLYARWGFEAVAVRRGYYQPSNTDALVMVKELTS